MEIGIDFEFFDSNEKIMSLVAASIDYPLYKDNPFKFNLLGDKGIERLKSNLRGIQKDKDTLLAYAVIAEARSLISLGLDPLDFEWIDLYAEFIMLCNSNNRYCYGNYINHTGSLAYSVPPDPSMTEEEKEADTEDHTECPKNLVNCAYKLLNVRLDASHKDAMRDLILSRDIPRIKEHMHEILEYCASDTKYLREIYKAICRAYELEGLTDFRQDMLARGRYAAAVAKSEALGIPIDFKLLNKIIEKTPEILQLGKDEVNAHFNFFIPEFQRPPITRKNGKVFIYKSKPAHKDMASYQRYVESLKIENFPRTKTSKFKADKDTLEEYGYWGGLEALWKYNKTESSLKWFNKDNKDGFFERVGSDKVVRPYFGIFGTQTGRNAAKAKTFPLAMSSWLRAIISPGVLPLREREDGHLFGQCIIGSDFSQQEVYVAAILSGDKNLLEAYNSGDVYLAFAIQAGMVPTDVDKRTAKTLYKQERDLCKSTVLGLQYGMGVNKLRTKLRLDTGKDVSLEETQALVDAHKNVFRTYWNWVREITNEYKAGTPLVTNDGWVLFCDNPVITSVRNFPVQGNSASITRLAVVMAWEARLKVMCSLHDAIYLITSEDRVELEMTILESIMKAATAKILKERVTTIRIDTKVINGDEPWVEDKGRKDWEKLKGFLM